MPRRTTYSKEQIETIFEMRHKGYKIREIADKVGKTPKAVAVFLERYRPVGNGEIAKKEKKEKSIFPVPEAMLAKPEPVVKEKKLSDFSSRELIRNLYDRGYRIEDNTLVFYSRQNVNLKDIIS